MEFDEEMQHAIGLLDNDYNMESWAVKEIIKNLEQNLNQFSIYYDKHFTDLQVQIEKLKSIVTSLERTHRNTTIGSLAGSVVGAAGGVATLVGIGLAPFTLGASMIVAGVGAGVAVAGGATNAVSSMAGMSWKTSDKEQIETILDELEITMSPIIERLKDIETYSTILNDIKGLNIHSADKLQAGFNALGKGVGAGAALARGIRFLNIGKVAAQASKTIRIAGAVTGVLSGLFVLMDIAFIAKDAKEIHNMNNMSADTPTENCSDTLKFIKEITDTVKNYEEVLLSLTEAKTDIMKELAFLKNKQ